MLEILFILIGFALLLVLVSAVSVFVSIGTTILLLGMTLVIRRRLTRAQAMKIVMVSGVLFVLSLVVFFVFQDASRKYIYEYPPPEISQNPRKHIHGALHERGVERRGEMSIQHAVYRFGGPEAVNANGTLWASDAYRWATNLLEGLYVFLILFLTAAIFSAGLAVERQLQARRK